MRTIQEQLADRIYELLPHKKELEFGCGITQIHFGKISNHVITTHCTSYAAESYWNTADGDKVNDKDIVGVKGQPLHLADLLLAIQEANPLVNYAIDITGEMTISEGIYRHNYIPTLCDYDLSRDNILEQSDEFCKFALEILNK
jgi:hypothetical protein